MCGDGVVGFLQVSQEFLRGYSAKIYVTTPFGGVSGGKFSLRSGGLACFGFGRGGLVEFSFEFLLEARVDFVG